MKSKGGRSKKAEYSTIMMRIPTPIKEDVLRLREKFYASLDKLPVTDITTENFSRGRADWHPSLTMRAAGDRTYSSRIA